MAGVKPIKDFEKVNEIINNARKSRVKILLAVGFITGFRISDLLYLKFGDLKGNEITVKEQKTGKYKRVKITEYLKDCISPSMKLVKIKDDDYIFTSQMSKGKPMTRQQADRIIKYECQKAGIEGRIGTHTLRKTSAYLVYKANGNDMISAMTHLNHSNIHETYTYLGLDDEYRDTITDKASELLKGSRKERI